jgi:prevent-host-death family protein
MRTVSAKDAKYHFGKLIDLARAAPVAVTKYDRAVVVVMAIEEYARLTRRPVKSPSRPKSASQGSRLEKTAAP